MDVVKFSKSFADFINQTRDKSKVSKYLHDYMWDHKIVCRHIKADKINYLTFRKDGTISYLPIGRELKYTDNGEWARDGRQEGKPAKTITQIMSSAMLKAVTSRDLEIFSNLYKGQATALYTIRETSGEGLSDIYGMPSNFGSCMKGSEHRPKLEIYEANPETIALLYVITPDGLCAARALLWTDIDGNKIIDRVYGGEEFSTMFREYAKEIGAYKKQSDSAGEGRFIAPDGSVLDKTFKIRVSRYDCDKYPYVDTFYFLDEGEGTLSNYKEGADKRLQDTGGGYDEVYDGVECFNRDELYPECVCSWSEYHGMYVHENDAIHVGNDVYYEADGEVEDAFATGRRSWILVSNCEEVECFHGDEHDGITLIRDISSFTMYQTPDGDLIDMDTDTVSVFVIDGEVMGCV